MGDDIYYNDDDDNNNNVFREIIPTVDKNYLEDQFNEAVVALRIFSSALAIIFSIFFPAFLKFQIDKEKLNKRKSFVVLLFIFSIVFFIIFISSIVFSFFFI